jgi:hypothetical protein
VSSERGWKEALKLTGLGFLNDAEALKVKDEDKRHVMKQSRGKIQVLT